MSVEELKIERLPVDRRPDRSFLSFQGRRSDDRRRDGSRVRPGRQTDRRERGARDRRTKPGGAVRKGAGGASRADRARSESDSTVAIWLRTAAHEQVVEKSPWPYPTITQSAGNYWAIDSDGISPPSDGYVNHKTFNCLVVGNHDDTAGAMSGDSVFRNPASPTSDSERVEGRLR